MDKKAIIRNLEAIKNNLALVSIRGGDAPIVANCLAGLDQTIILVANSEDKSAEPVEEGKPQKGSKK